MTFKTHQKAEAVYVRLGEYFYACNYDIQTGGWRCGKCGRGKIAPDLGAECLVCGAAVVGLRFKVGRIPPADKVVNG